MATTPKTTRTQWRVFAWEDRLATEASDFSIGSISRCYGLYKGSQSFRLCGRKEEQECFPDARRNSGLIYRTPKDTGLRTHEHRQNV